MCCQHVQQTKVSCWSRNFTRKETFLKNYVQHPILSCIGLFKKEKKKKQLSVRSSFKGARSMSRLIHTDTRRVAGGRSFEPLSSLVCYDTLQTPHCYRCSRMMSIIPPLLRICSSTSGFLGFIISPRSFSCISNDILTQPLTKHCL